MKIELPSYIIEANIAITVLESDWTESNLEAAMAKWAQLEAASKAVPESKNAVSVLGKSVDAIKKKTLGEMSEKLQQATAKAEGLAGGAKEGRSWKDGLPERPSWTEIANAARGFTKPPMSKDLVAVHKKLQEEPLCPPLFCCSSHL